MICGAGRAQGCDLRVEEFGREGAGEGFDGGLLLGRKRLALEAKEGAGEFGFADAFRLGKELFNGGGGGRLIELLGVAGDLKGDDALGGFGFAGAAGAILLRDLLEVVDVVDKAAFEGIDFGRNVARDGDIDKEDGAVAAAGQQGAGVRRGEDLAGTCGSENDVGAVRLLVQLRERDDPGGDGGRAEGVGNLFGAGFGAVGDKQRGGALLDEVTRRQIAHFAGTDEQNGFAGEGAEDFAGKIGGHRGDRNGGSADLCFGADAFGNGEGTLQQRIEHGFDGADFAGDGERLLHLAKDLGFADDHGIERTGDTKQVADGFGLTEMVKVRLDVGRAEIEEVVKEAGRGGGVAGRVSDAVLGAAPGGTVGRQRSAVRVADREQLDTVAGGKDHGFADAGFAHKGEGGFGEAVCRNGKAFAHRDGRGGVVDAHQQKRAAGGACGGEDV